VVPERLVQTRCPSCNVDLTFIVDHRGPIYMMQPWTCVVCRTAQDAAFTKKIRQVVRRIEPGRRIVTVDL